MRVREAALSLLALSLGAPAPAPASPPDPQVLIYNTEDNRLRRYDVDTIGAPGGLVEDVLQPSAEDVPGTGRDSNGLVCRFPDGTGRYVHGEDTGQPLPPAGFGVFEADGRQIGKLTPTYPVYSRGQPEPFGCAIRSDGILFTTDVGEQDFGTNNGQLVMWFPPYDHFPGPPPPDPSAYPNNAAASANFCKIDETIGTAGSVVVDAFRRVYVASKSGLVVYRHEGIWPKGLGPGEGCEAHDSVGTPMVDPGRINRRVLIAPDGLSTFSGLAISPDGRRLYASTVFEGKIREYTITGNFRRFVVDHAVPVFDQPKPFGSPQSLAFGPDGTLYYADLDLRGSLPDVGPGPNGKVWRVRFENDVPQTPEIVREGLRFPDGVAVLSGDLEPERRRSLAGGPKRQSFYGEESIITSANVQNLRARWTFRAEGPVTGSPVVAEVDVPGEGVIRVVYFLSWDRSVYAVRFDDGTLLWRVETDEQPNATFPTVASVDVAEIDGRDVAYIGSGEIFYALDAATGDEVWRFTAGTGCGALGAGGPPPGFCSRATGDERNEIEGSAVVAGGIVLVTLDVNDRASGKGGVFGLDARDGRMRWFFDLESGSTCRPGTDEQIRQYDPYHAEAELNLPPGFLSRPGCDHPRSRNGCGNVWSSPAVDYEREAFYLASSNCDTDFDNGTSVPEPPMPPYDEAIFALGFDGRPVWVWRPREVDNDDLAFGAAPNLFEIEFGGATRQVVGVGNKDGTYYVLDRDGTNEVTGQIEPYWHTRVVDGGDIGGIVATAAVDEGARRIYFSTGPGDGTLNDPATGRPAQQPTLHALDMDTGAIVWQNDAANGFPTAQLASFGPTSASPGLVYFNQLPGAVLRIHRSDTGRLRALEDLGNLAGASQATVRDGMILVGEGIGPGFPATFASDVTALCVRRTLGCAACDNGIDDDGDGKVDASQDEGCSGRSDVSERGECEDGLDNDHDGRIDHPDDPGCRSGSVISLEAPACDDGIDNDGDGAIDLADGGCPFGWWLNEEVPPVLQLALAPPSADLRQGDAHTVEVEIRDQLTIPYPEIPVSFEIRSGPHAGGDGVCAPNPDCTTDVSGRASFTYVGTGGGVDTIVATVLDTAGQPVESNAVEATWNAAPRCEAAVAEPSWLWPPNGRFHAVALTGVDDPDGDPVALAIEGVWQDEPVADRRRRKAAPDAEAIDGDSVRLRAERDGRGDGRVYHVGFRASDGRGGECAGNATVCVPHDRRGTGCGDGGALYDSTAGE